MRHTTRRLAVDGRHSNRHRPVCMSEETKTESAPARNPRKSGGGKLKPLPLPVAVPKWPFLTADIIFIGLGYWISTLIQGDPQSWQIISILVCAGLGAGFAVAPFYFEYRAEAKAVEIAQLTTVAKEVNKMEEAAKLIAEASANWSSVQETSEQTAKLAEEIASGMAATVKDHDAFMATANTEELSTLKLEIEKLRRVEADWANTLVGVLDLVYRLEQSAIASGKEQFIQTMGQFQGQCREVARRVGLVAFEAENGTPFNAEEHALPDGESAEDNATISQTRLPGFKMQGKLVRKPLVAVG